MDGRNTLSLSLGKAIAKNKNSKSRFTPMLGVVYSTKSKEFFGAVTLFFRYEEVRGKEFSFYLKSISKEDHLKLIFESEYLFCLSKTIKLGPSASFEAEEESGFYDIYGRTELGSKHSRVLNLVGSIVYQPLGFGKLSFAGFAGLESKFEKIKKDNFPSTREKEKKPIFGLGLIFVL
jgi:hypothetical protein